MINKFKNHRKLIVIIVLVFILAISTFFEKEYDRIFYVQETGTYVFTKKKYGGRFLVMFSDKENASFSSNIDYIETDTGATLLMIFDSLNKKDIIIKGFRKNTQLNKVKYNLTLMEDNCVFFSKLDCSAKNNQLKDSYIVLNILTDTYFVTLNDSVLYKSFWGW